MLPVFIVVAESVTFVIGLGIFMLVLVLLNHAPEPEVLILTWVFLIQQMLALGMGLILAVLNVFLRDVREAVAMVVQLWFWVTPIVWAPQIVPPQLYSTIKMTNPMAPSTSAYHAMCLPGTIDYTALMRLAVPPSPMP